MLGCAHPQRECAAETAAAVAAAAAAAAAAARAVQPQQPPTSAPQAHTKQQSDLQPQPKEHLKPPPAAPLVTAVRTESESLCGHMRCEISSCAAAFQAD